MLFFFALFIFGLLAFLLFNSHYLMILLSLEMILLAIVSMMPMFNATHFFFFLLIMACLGGFSISFLISIFRSYGKDFWQCYF